MFSFTLSEKFKAKGLPSDLISPALRNRYDAIFSEPNLDRRIQVRLGETAIRFFIYTGELNENLSVEEKYVEIASISLTNAQETARDLLFFQEQCKKNCQPDSLLWRELGNDFWQKLEKVSERLYNENRFSDFPFVEAWERRRQEQQEKFAFFMQCCFLYFVLDFENRDSDFSNSEIYDDVRDKLRRSFVYRLLCAKLKYTLYLFDGNVPQSDDEYSFKVGAFADLLMDKTINKVIPSSYYLENKWFYNPEEELEKIVDTYNDFQREQARRKKLSSAEKKRKEEKKDSLLYDGLLNDIRDFFFTKHAVIAAMKVSARGRAYGWYIAYLWIVGIFSLSATCCLLGDIGESWLLYFWAVVAAVSLAFLIYVMLKVSSANTLMPRILVALSIGWLTAFISEDLIKSQLEVTPIFVCLMLTGVLGIIIVLLLGEAKQHSSYYSLRKEFCGWKDKKKKSSVKLTPILVHSYFWAITFGLLMQFVLYPGLLKNSQALPEIVFQDTFDDAEDYVMELSNFRTALITYRDDLDGMFVKAGAISGVARSLKKDVEVQHLNLYYSDNDLDRIRIRGKSKVDNIYNKFAATRDSLQKEVAILDSALPDNYRFKDVNNVTFGATSYYHIDSLVNDLVRRVDIFYTSLSPIDFDNTISEQLNCLDMIINETDAEIQNTRHFISSCNDYDVLIKWSAAKFDEQEHIMRASVSDIMTNRAIVKHPFSKRVMFFGSQKFAFSIFPRMLILHALIVLIIAFVGQLIISDKSVTEPL